MPLPFIRGGSATQIAGRRPLMKRLGMSLACTDWRLHLASWSGSCAQLCAATRAMLCGG